MKMLRKKRHSIFAPCLGLIAGLAIVLLNPVSAPGAILNTNPVLQVCNGAAYKLSVYPGKAAYTGLVAGVFGDGTVLDYRLYNNTSLTNGGYASGGGGRVGTISYAGGLTDYNMDLGDVWNATDPGPLTNGIPAFSTIADVGGTNQTMSGQQYVTNTVNIANMATGTVYVLCGSYQNSFTVTLTMQGSGQPDLVQQFSIVPPSTRNTYITSAAFANPDNTYTTIRIGYACTAGNRARYMGVILDGVSPPSGSALRLR